MKSIISVVIATLFSTSAIATSNEHHKPSKPTNSSIEQKQGQGQAQLQGQLQGQAQIAVGGSAAGGTANASIAPMSFSFTTINPPVNNSPSNRPAAPNQPVAPTQPTQPASSAPAMQDRTVTTNGKVTIRQAPDIGLQLGSPTSNCMNVLGFGGSNASGGGLVSFSVGVEWCKGFEMARQAKNHGLDTLAEDLICNVEEVKVLNSPDCAGARDRAKETAKEKAASEQAKPNSVFNSN